MHREQLRTRGIHPGHNKIRPDVPLVAEEVLLQHGHAGDDARLAAGGERMQFEIRGDEGGCELSVSGCAGAGAPDLGSDVMELLAIFVGDDGAGGCAGVCCYLFTCCFISYDWMAMEMWV